MDLFQSKKDPQATSGHSHAPTHIARSTRAGVNWAKLWEVARFEIAYQIRRRSIWLFGAAVPVLAFYVMKNLNDGAVTDGTVVNAPIEIVNATFLASVVGLLVAAALAGDAATRDVETRMASLVYTAPVRKWTYLAGRFLGALVLYAALQASVPFGILLAGLTSGISAESIRFAAHVQPYLLFALPNAFVSVAILFTAALLSRRALASYGAGAALFIIMMFNLEAGPILYGWGLSTQVDALGAGSIRFLVKSWTTAERNTLLVPFEGAIVMNRLLWLGVATAALALGHARFRFAHPDTKQSWISRLGRLPLHQTTAKEQNNHITVPSVQQAFHLGVQAHQTLAVAVRSFRNVATQRGWILALAGVVLVVSTGPELLEHLGVPYVPTTSRVLTMFDATSFGLLVVAFIVFYAGELIWTERDAGLQPITDAAPVPDGVLLAGKFISLSVVIVALQTLLLGGGIILQIALGYPNFDLGVYAATLFGFQLANYVLIAILALTVHVVVNQKYVGHLIILVAYAFTRFAGSLRIEHNLLVYGSDAGWTYSDFVGFGPSIAPFILFKLYWMGWALLLALAARAFWVRGLEHELRSRVRFARRRMGRAALATAALGAALILSTGGFIFYNTNVLNDYRTAADGQQRRAEYERLYGRYKTAPQPELTSTKLHVEIYPERRTATVRGVYHLVNRSGVAIDTIHIATASEVETGVAEFSRPAEPAVLDDDLGHRIYVLKTPLQPGEQMQMQYDVQYMPRGFTNQGISSTVAQNGTYIETMEWLPAVGYQPDRELRRARDRLRQGLSPLAPARSLDDAAGRMDVSGREMIDFEATVATTENQIALAPGTLRRSWTENGRRYFHYVTAAPIRNGHAFVSAEYGVRRARWKDVEIEILHHPNHTLNLDRMIRSVETSLNHFTERYGRYPYRQIRLVEVPGAGSGLRAYPINIRYTEGFALLDPERDWRNIDFPFAVVAHEVAHQWWGDQVIPADIEGAPLVSESLAWYSAFGAVEDAYGEAHLRRLLSLLRDVYQDPRPQADVPLLRASDWFTAYRKGPFAMYAVREYVGADRVDAALRRLFERYGGGERPRPTSLDLYAELQAATPDSLKYLLVDLFERNTFWELTTRQATVAATEAGEWQVTMDVTARKLEIDRDGTQTEHPMDDLVEIGVHAAVENGKPGELIYLKQHHLRSGEQSIVVTTPEKPVRAGIDPRNLLIDAETADNIVNISTTTTK